ncbi:TIGR03084 family metal-binding protein [Solicola sp. PLA-1-18]|uniref:TIGR03084 family metal-binding protein n=1 Tax=Solicola sp. PLA-1-18 TaxID=3380532 RepID=UPI003B760E22
MNDVLDSVLADLATEGDALRALVADLPADGWRTPTPSPGWTVAHQVAHLHWTDDVSVVAISDAEGFASLLERAAGDPAGVVDAAAERLVALPSDELLRRWDATRTMLVDALRGVPSGTRIGWFGPPMSAASMATARLMETWAHGQDVAEALGHETVPHDRARHVAHLGVRTRGFAYAVHGLAAPTSEVRVELAAPSGDTWAWGPEDAEQRVTGSGWDFALLATRRRHRDDVDVHAHGADADEWLGLVQAFAGLPGPDPQRRGAPA